MKDAMGIFTDVRRKTSPMSLHAMEEDTKEAEAKEEEAKEEETKEEEAESEAEEQEKEKAKEMRRQTTTSAGGDRSRRARLGRRMGRRRRRV